VWKAILADAEEDRKPAAKRTSVAAVERTSVAAVESTSVDAADERKPAAKKRTPVDPPGDLVPQSDFLNTTVLRPVPLRMVLGDAPKVPMGTGPEQSDLDNGINSYAIKSDRPPTVAKITQFCPYAGVLMTDTLDMDPRSSTWRLPADDERYKDLPDSIRALTDPEKNENLFKVKVNNISSPACFDDQNDYKTENQENTVKTEDDHSGTYDRKKITDFTEEEKQKSKESRIEKMTKTKTKMIPDKIFFPRIT